MAFRAALQQLDTGERVKLHFTGQGAARMDMEHIVCSAFAQAHLYACGPSGLIDGFIAAAQSANRALRALQRSSPL